MKKSMQLFLVVFSIAGISILALYSLNKYFLPNNSSKPIKKEKPLLAYTFNNLRKTKFLPSVITLGEKVDETQDYISQMFYFSVPKRPNGKDKEKVSGLINLPKKPGTYPIIVMFRGFVPKKIYKPGIDTQPAASVFVKHGFITLAPDFLGYGQSASTSANEFEDRFQTYTTALTFLASLKTLNIQLKTSYSGRIEADISKIGIWAHSNGGHIALSVLSISGLTYPTVLWAPVSKSFPYSILYYTDESDDQGKALRKALAEFEKDYDTDKFSPPKYYNLIKAPIEINQGTADQEVPVWWSDQLVEILRKDKINVSYFTYPGANHNLMPNGWSNAVLENINFYNMHFNH